MPSRFFPPASLADEDGLVCIGGKLSAEWLLDAYRHGIFPWPHGSVDPMLWWSPDPRAIFPLDNLHVPSRLQRRLRSGQFEASINRAFPQVIDQCAHGPGREGGTWLFPEMIAAYTDLHDRGHAHSVEIWSAGQLVGGIYGVAVGGLFAAKSMFHLVSDASKAALARLVRHLAARNYRLMDIQQWTPHTARMGAKVVRRREYLRLLQDALQAPCTFGDCLETPGD